MYFGNWYVESLGKWTWFCQGFYVEDLEITLCTCVFGLFLGGVLRIVKYDLVL